MRTWNGYKTHVKKIDPDMSREISEMENLASVVGTIIEQRNALGISQRGLATLSAIPQSSVARVESIKTSPRLDTLLKLMHPLGLRLNVSMA